MGIQGITARRGRSNAMFVAVFGGILAICIGVLLLSRQQGADGAGVGSDVAARTPSDRPTPLVDRERQGEAAEDEPSAVTAAAIETANWRLHGRVLAEVDGTPIGGAQVLLFIDPRGSFSTPSQRVTADPAGEFEFLLPRSTPFSEAMVLGARAPGYAAWLELVERAGADRLPRETRRDITLVPASTLEGIVQTPDGTPVRAATVGLYARGDWTGLRSDDFFQMFPAVETDSAGRFRIEDAPNGGQTAVLAEKMGFLPAMEEIGLPAGGLVVLTMRPGEARIRGRVINGEGAPIPNLPVKAIHMREGSRPSFDYPRQPPNTNEIYTSTDEVGEYAFDALLAGWTGVIAGHGQPVGSSSGEVLFLDKGDDKSLTIRIPGPYDFEGIVVDRETEAPIPGVRVTTSNPGDTAYRPPAAKNSSVGPRETVTGLDGAFTLPIDHTVEMDLGQAAVFRFLLPEPYALAADHWQARGADEDVPDDTPDIFRFRKARTLAGVVVDDAGTPVSGAQVWAGRQTRWSLVREDQIPAVTTGGDGRFALRQANARELVLVAESGGARGQIIVERPLDDADDLKIVLEGGLGAIVGRVTIDGGAPLAPFEIRAISTTRSGDPPPTAISDAATGDFRFEEIPAGAYLVRVEDLSRELTQGWGTRAEVVAGRDSEEVILDLRSAEPFEGTVVNEDGLPVVGAEVLEARRLRGPGANRVYTDGTGLFRLSVEVPEDGGLHRLVIRHDEYEELITEGYLLEESPVEIVLKRRGGLRFTVRTESGRIPANIDYTISRPRSQMGRDDVNFIQRTAFEVAYPIEEPVTTGDYTIDVFEIDGTGERTGLKGDASFTAVPGKTTDVEVILEDGARLAGRVVTPDGDGIADAEVTLVYTNRTVGGSWRRLERAETTSGEDGSFEFAGLLAGEIRLEAEKAPLVLVEPVELESWNAAPEQGVEIVLGGGAVLAGRVIDVEGDPFTGARVVVGSVNEARRGRDGQGAAVISDSEEYRIEGLRPGRESVILRGPSGDILKAEPIELENAETTTLDFDFTGMVAISGRALRGSRDLGRSGLTMVFEPLDPGPEPVLVLTDASSAFESRVLPGTYAILVQSPGRNVTADTGMEVTVDPRPLRQEVNLSLQLVDLEAVIVPLPGENILPGELTYTHRNERGREMTSTFTWRSDRFSIGNQPLGSCRAIFVDIEGRRYVSDWHPVAPGTGIVTLVPEEFAGG